MHRHARRLPANDARSRRLDRDRREQRATRGGHRMLHRTPAVACARDPQTQRAHAEREPRSRDQQSPPVPTPRLGRKHSTATGEQLRRIVGRLAAQRARVGHLEGHAHRPFAHSALRLHCAGDRAHTTVQRRDRAPTLDTPCGERQRREPDHERCRRRCAQPARIGERPRREREHDASGRNPDAGSGRRGGTDDGAAFPGDLLANVHGVGRLVTAYANRLTPKRSACSCNSGGSLYVPTFSHPVPRSLSYE